MTEKDLKKLNRYQLLELLIMQTERADKLQAIIDNTTKQLNEQELKLASLGSIAEAALELKGVFQLAQDAADMYVHAAQKRAAEIEEEARKKASEIITLAEETARHIKGK